MATQLKSNILETFVTVLGGAMIDAIYNDKFFFSLFENAASKFGADTINKQGDTVKINVKPTYIALERVEGTPVNFQNSTIASINLTLNHQAVVPIEMSIQAQTASAQDLLTINQEGALNAIFEKFETDLLKDTALDAGIPALNKYTVTAFDKAFFVDLNARFFQNKAADKSDKFLIVDPVDYAAILADDALTSFNSVGATALENSRITGLLPLPRFGIQIKRSNLLNLNTVTGKKQRVACTGNSLIMQARPLVELYTVMSKRVDSLDGKMSILFSMMGDNISGVNRLTADCLYGSKVYLPQHVFVIEK
jgi:hypothetical protein